MEPKFTKGRWLIKHDEVGYISDHDDQSFGMFCPIAIVHDEDNRILISAAPDMYEALQNIAEYWNQDQNPGAMVDACWHAIETARAALAKARGE